MRLAVAIVLCAGCHSGVSTDPHKTGTDGVDSGYPPPTCDPVAVINPPVAGTCADAEGPIKAYTCTADLEKMIIGKWRYCSGEQMLRVGEAGIEIDADYTYTALVDDGSGHLVKKTGFDFQGTWDTYQETSTWPGFYYHPTPNSGNGGAVVFEDSPRRFSIGIGYEERGSVYVYEGP